MRMLSRGDGVVEVTPDADQKIFVKVFNKTLVVWLGEDVDDKEGVLIGAVGDQIEVYSGQEGDQF